ncbi:MAG: homoserine kinase [Aerococcaceae bacterium]|nr:homoserine kinase [Aerococcaceae bacterium]
MKFECKIPATSANLGPGFDSIGIALQKYLTVKAQLSKEWTVAFEDDFLNVLPKDATNYVIQVACRVANHFQKEMPALALTMASDIPLTHGLGSSATAIVAGIELANYYLDLKLSEFDKIYLASLEEGHPDNVGPCITGGVFVGYFAEKKLYYEVMDLQGVAAIISTPHYELSTKESRKVLPQAYTKADSINQNALSSVMVLSLLKQNFVQMGQLMMQDKFHEPYRQPLIAEFAPVKETALANGAYATVISGAGPSILTLCPAENVSAILDALRQTVDCAHEEVAILNRKASM